MAAAPAHLEGCRRGRPLKQAIQECELRWFHETAAAAADGEANQMALLGHMFTVGYGCKRDPEQASKWFSEASKRLGYNVLSDQPPLMSSVGPAPQQQQQPPYQPLLEQQQQGRLLMQQPYQPLLHQGLPGGPAGSSSSNHMFRFTSGTAAANTAAASAAAAAAAAAAAGGAMQPQEQRKQQQQQPAGGPSG